MIVPADDTLLSITVFTGKLKLLKQSIIENAE